MNSTKIRFASKVRFYQIPFYQSPPPFYLYDHFKSDNDYVMAQITGNNLQLGFWLVGGKTVKKIVASDWSVEK
jgi:hypothetical protein